MGRPKKEVKQDNQTDRQTVDESVNNNAEHDDTNGILLESYTITVDKKLFYELVYSLVTGNTSLYTGMSGVVSLGKILGAETFEEQKSICDKIINDVVDSQRTKNT